MVKNEGRIVVVIISVLLFLTFTISSAYGFTVSLSSDKGSFTEKLAAGDRDSVQSISFISASGVSHSAVGRGSLKERHSVSNRAGAFAEVGVDIQKAALYSYRYFLSPGSGSGWRTAEVQAGEMLDVTNAQYIKAYADAKNARGSAAGVSTEIFSGSLRGYSNLATASASDVSATQKFDISSGTQVQAQEWAETGLNHVDTGTLVKSGSLSGYAGQADASAAGLDVGQQLASALGWQIQTQSNSISGGSKMTTEASVSTKALGAIYGLEGSVTRNSPKEIEIQEKSHVTGTFTSKATAGTSSKTRTSNYGMDYDVEMSAGKGALGSFATGTLGYYVASSRPEANRIQGAVSASESGDTVNVAAGAYHENVNLNKNLTLKGTGGPTADRFTLNSGAALGSGTGGITAAAGTVNEGARIWDGILLVSDSGTVNVNHGSYNDDLDQSFYARSVRLVGEDAATTHTRSISLDRPVDGRISGLSGDTMNVTSTNAKIQEGVDLASEGGTVNVAAGTYQENVVVDKSVSIAGAGRDRTIVDGTDHGSVFTVGRSNGEAHVDLSKMAIQGGSGTYTEVGGSTEKAGGGIWNNGTLIVHDCSVLFNLAWLGSGIFNAGDATIEDSTIWRNKRPWNNGFQGAGIYNAGTGTLTVRNSTISENVAQQGGGIFNLGTATIEACNISGNIGTVYSYGNSGGGIYNEGTVSVKNSLLSRNRGESDGGAVFNSGSATFENVTISGNYAGQGAGIFNWGNVALKNSTISGNEAHTNGGGIVSTWNVTIEGSTVSGNTAGGYGGGLWNSREATIRDSTISKNWAYYGGGGIYWEGIRPTVDPSTVYNNSALYGGQDFDPW